MATIRSQMVLNDGMSGVLKKIIKALDTTLNAFEQVQRASGNTVNVEEIRAARVALVQAANGVEEMADAYHRAAKEEEKLNQGIQNGTKAADGMLNKVKGLVTTLAAGAGVKALLNLSDQMTSTTARLNFIVDDGGTVDELEQKIMASAQRSRAAYLDTASAIASMGSNAGSAFESNDELIAFMEQVNKQFVIGGATAEGQSAAMLQLTQAMAAGALRGEELNSILENAPGIARAIESYMGAAEGSIKSYAEQGLITSEVVKNALLSAAEDTYDEMGNLIEGTNSKFESMPKTWAQIWIGMQNTALAAFDPILTKLNQVANSAQFNTVVNGAITALSTLAAVASGVLDLLISGAAFVVDNWSWIEPIIWGVVGALIAYNAVQGISWLTTLKDIAAKGAHAVASAAETAAILVLIAAQDGLNAAIAACPITWIVMAVIALIAVFYAAVAAINHFAGTSLSATGIIMGAFAVAGAFLINLVLGVVNFVIGLGVELYNLIATFANFFANVFNDPVGAIINLFAGMFDFILGIVQSAASLIDTVLGTDMSGAVANFRGTVATKVEEIVGDQVEVMEKLDASDYQVQRIEYGDAWAAGNNLGKGIEDAVSGLFDFDLGAATDYGTGLGDYGGFATDDIVANTGETAANTGAAADALSTSTEELEYLRDIAERDAINRFTTAEVKIDMTGMQNRIEGGADLDGVISTLTDGFTEALLTAAEGVHA